MRHINIPIFIPHLGCPNSCAFCNQRAISGVKNFDIASVPEQLEAKLNALPEGKDLEVELAYFGGSFTAIDKKDMRFLLETARRFLESGRISAARISTRPDHIDDTIIDMLKSGGISTVELGVQSMSDRVLNAAKRGHTSADTIVAVKRLKAAGLSVVGQMMIGLPESGGDDETATARELCELGVDGARIYPLVVLDSTELKEMGYTPLCLDEAVRRAADALEVFILYNVKVLRIGLCASEDLFDAAGYSPAFGELTMGEVYLRRMRKALLEHGEREVVFALPAGEVSKASGQHRTNKRALCDEFRLEHIKFIENKEMEKYTVKIIL